VTLDTRRAIKQRSESTDLPTAVAPPRRSDPEEARCDSSVRSLC
jgi:hypothetical protein